MTQPSWAHGALFCMWRVCSGAATHLAEGAVGVVEVNGEHGPDEWQRGRARRVTAPLLSALHEVKQ